jgi:hypothetical protein
MGPALAIISHPVKDYAAWRAVYNSVEPFARRLALPVLKYSAIQRSEFGGHHSPLSSLGSCASLPE